MVSPSTSRSIDRPTPSAAQTRATLRRRATRTPAVRKMSATQGQPAADRNDGPIGRLHSRDLIGLRDGDRPVHRWYSGGDRHVAGEQSRLDVLDDGTELNADRPVALGRDQGLRIVAQRGEKLSVAYPEGALPALGEGLGGNIVLYSVTDDRLNALGGRFPPRRRARRSPAVRFRVP